jgi:hypothetical protein
VRYAGAVDEYQAAYAPTVVGGYFGGDGTPHRVAGEKEVAQLVVIRQFHDDSCRIFN